MVERPPASEWVRAREGRMIAGVARGLADRFGVAPALVRLAFVLATILGLWGLAVYAALWVVMPLAPPALPPARTAEPAAAAPNGGGS